MGNGTYEIGIRLPQSAYKNMSRSVEAAHEIASHAGCLLGSDLPGAC